MAMNPDDPETVWREYYALKREERLQEAAVLWSAMQAAGVGAETVLAVDFLHIASAEENARALETQLSENYQMEVAASGEEGYWVIRGTTRPYGITLGHTQLLDWVGFMSDVAQSYACVFSTWSAEAPALGRKFESETIKGAS
jgi:hypothetical protein